MFQDSEGAGIKRFISESSIDESIFDFLELDEADRDEVMAFMDYSGLDFASAQERFQDATNGVWESARDFAWHIFEECCSDVYQFLDNQGMLNYFDIDAYAHDLFISDYYYDDASGYVFSRNW